MGRCRLIYQESIQIQEKQIWLLKDLPEEIKDAIIANMAMLKDFLEDHSKCKKSKHDVGMPLM